MTTRTPWFLDASFPPALSSGLDQGQRIALVLDQRIRDEGISLVTTRPVLLEIGNSLAQQRFRQAALNLLDAMEFDPRIQVVPLSEDLYRRQCSCIARG